MVSDRMNKKVLLLVLLGFCALFITGCGKKEIPEKYAQLMADKSGAVVRLCFYGSPEEIDPLKAAELEHDTMFCNMVYASPLRKTGSGTYEPYLIESYETRLEGNNLVFSGKWRQGLKWHDGQSFEPSEFEYSVNQMVSPEKNSPYSEAAKKIVSIKNDSENLEIVFPDNSIKYLDMLCAGLLPGHILSKEKIASGTIEEAYKNFIAKPVGLGPYKVVDNDKNKYMLLEPDANFFDGKGSKRPKIAIICSYELQQTLSDFRENLFDWMSAPSMIAEQLQNLGVENIVYVQHQNPAVLTWVFNSKSEKLKDVRVRKALNLIMDRSCAKNSYGSGATELFDNLIPQNEASKSLSERIEEGKKLLEEAGVVDKNNDGIREYNGSDFKISLVVNSDSMSRRMIAEKMSDHLKTLGISTEIQVVNWNDFVNAKLKKGEFDTALLSYHISDNCSMKSLFATKKAEDSESLNFTGISDDELDRNLAILDMAVTNENKAEAYKKVNEKLSELCPCAFLLRPSNLALIHGNPVQTVKSATTLWNDVFNWKLMFGKEDSKL